MGKAPVIIVIVLAFFGCVKSGPSEHDARAAYEGYRGSKQFCVGQVQGFRKTNGLQRGMGGTNYYVIEFEAKENRASCWEGFWKTKASTLLIGGEIYFIQTEKGWKPQVIECGEKIDGRWVVTGFCRSSL